MSTTDPARSHEHRENEVNVALWSEAIALMRSAHSGDQLAGRIVLDTTTDLRPLTEMLLQLLEVHLLDTDDAAMCRFLSVAADAGPPPRYGFRPMPHAPRRAAS